MTQTRNLGIDCLRLVLMFFIILGHLFAHTHIRQELPILSPNGIWCWGWQTISLCAVNCFVLITGYFMFYSRWKFIHLLKLWVKILVYAIGIGSIFLLMGKATLSLPTILNMFFPLLRSVWWFMSVYALLYLCIPFLNIWLHQLTSRQFTLLVSGILVIFYILPIFSFFFPPYDRMEGMGIVGFITLYILGAYVAVKQISLPCKWIIIGLIVNNMCIFASKVLLGYVVGKYHLTVGTGLLYHYNTIFELLNAVLLLLLFKQIPWTYGSKLIVESASSVFAVYLLHEHPLVRQVLWQNSGLPTILQQTSFIEFALLSCLVPLLILSIGILIDKLTHLILLNPIFHSKFWDYVATCSQQGDALFSQTEFVCRPR